MNRLVGIGFVSILFDNHHGMNDPTRISCYAKIIHQESGRDDDDIDISLLKSDESDDARAKKAFIEEVSRLDLVVDDAEVLEVDDFSQLKNKSFLQKLGKREPQFKVGDLVKYNIEINAPFIGPVGNFNARSGEITGWNADGTKLNVKGAHTTHQREANELTSKMVHLQYKKDDDDDVTTFRFRPDHTLKYARKEIVKKLEEVLPKIEDKDIWLKIGGVDYRPIDTTWAAEERTLEQLNMNGSWEHKLEVKPIDCYGNPYKRNWSDRVAIPVGGMLAKAVSQWVPQGAGSALTLEAVKNEYEIK